MRSWLTLLRSSRNSYLSSPFNLLHSSSKTNSCRYAIILLTRGTWNKLISFSILISWLLWQNALAACSTLVKVVCRSNLIASDIINRDPLYSMIDLSTSMWSSSPIPQADWQSPINYNWQKSAQRPESTVLNLFESNKMEKGGRSVLTLPFNIFDNKMGNKATPLPQNPQNAN